ncbi:MAG: prepilin-type N-terminal cleavage/methylation domain-containing protein [Myxococcota bacterium]|nr:prepilin-type N-terminal cleavage/methylation domain-containing protein [Myxococcota bacterium]
MSTDHRPERRGFTLLEVLVALAILAISVLVLIDAQTASVNMRQQGEEMVVGTLLARDVMSLVELRLEKEGFGELTISERGDFREEEYLDAFPDHKWEYEVSRVELDLGKILNMVSQLMGMAEDEGAVEDSSMLTGGFSLESLGIDPMMFTEELSRYIREVRVRVYWCEDASAARNEGWCGPDEVVLVTHVVNPTGRVTNAEEQEIGGLGGIGGIGSGVVEGAAGAAGGGGGTGGLPSLPGMSGGSGGTGRK